ncbi:putative protein phosphatase 2C 33 [Vitis vinifera]|uniref:PPM-type phosphatase domain-containing protein n=1 Tax=Vitis vinifera TaxID=29760 RepID=A0A438JE43_VITVI|nr:putative protein phosphatase 2C 33 [Vitis vinifera]
MGSCLSAESSRPLPSSPSGSLGVRRRKNSKRRLGSRTSSFDSRREEQLHKIPGRMFLNGASDFASLFTQQGKKGTNQDAMICLGVRSSQQGLDAVWISVLMALSLNFGSRTDTVFCGVFDGHGPYGHMVAKRVRDSFPKTECTLGSQYQ